MKKLKDSRALRILVLGILCFIAAYLAEPHQGAVATIPFIAVLPALGLFVYNNLGYALFFCAFGGFFTRCAFTADVPSSLLFALECTIIGLLSCSAALCIMYAKNKNNKKKIYGISALIFVISIVIFVILHGTFFGNTSSKKLSEKYISNTYTGEKFTVGSTYYSPLDMCYLTEFRFIDDEIYMAQVSAKSESEAKIDGYHDYCHARLLEEGTDILRGYFSSLAHEGEDFALRRNRIETNDLLTRDSVPEDYFADMCYDVAFYREFSNPEDFMTMCRQYVDYLPEIFLYREINFLGLGDNGKFAYNAQHSRQNDTLTFFEFDEKSFVKYKHNKDTNKYFQCLE